MIGVKYLDAKSALWFFIVLLTVSWATLCYGQFGGGSGTEDDPWQIGRVYHLDNIRNYVGFLNNDKFFIQTHDIDLGMAPWNQGEGWSPIGESENQSFQGHYDGNGFVISGLTINRPNSDHQGLFGYVLGAQIKNVTVENVNIIGGEGLGGLVGWSIYYTVVDNCYSSGYLRGFRNTGGLLGYNGIYSTVINSSSSCRVEVTDARSGGLVGYHDYFSSISKSFSTGNVSGFREVGGFVGRSAASATIDLCYSTGNANGNNQIGGLVGRNGISCRINNSYSRGSASGTRKVGGLVGLITIQTYISKSYSTGRVNGNLQVGGLIGENQQSSVVQSYWDAESSGQYHSAAGFRRRTTEMTYPYSVETYVDWDFDEIWKEDFNTVVNDGYPYLSWQIVDYPNIAMSPNPADNASGISVEPEMLQWRYLSSEAFADPAGFRVYFNTTGRFSIDDDFDWIPFSEEQEIYTTSEILPDSLEYGTGYYWKVVPTTKADGTGDGEDARDCPVWSFVTELYPIPESAVNPFPAEDSVGVSIELEELKWSYIADTTIVSPAGFRVYFNDTGEFGEDDDYGWRPFFEGQEIYSISEILPDYLDYFSEYYWIIVPTTRRYGVGEGEDAEDYAVWSFVTELNPIPESAVNPFPADDSVGVSINLEELRWSYIADTTIVSPAGFRVYFNDTGEFGEDDDFEWITFIEDQELYIISEILPQSLESETEYYWKVVSTTKENGVGEGRDAEDVSVWSFLTESDTSADQPLPVITELKTNYPNPFNPETIIEFSVKEDAYANISIYNIKGQLVRVLYSEVADSGEHKVTWDGSDSNGTAVSSGIYFYRLTTDEYDKTKKMMLVK